WYLLNQLPVKFTPQYANLFVAMSLLFWVGIATAADPWIKSRIRWSVFVLGVGFFPPVFAILSQTLKDGLMTAALSAAYGGLVVAERRRSYAAYAWAIICLFLALGFRHNAVFATLPLALWAGFILGDELFAAGAGKNR